MILADERPDDGVVYLADKCAQMPATFKHNRSLLLQIRDGRLYCPHSRLELLGNRSLENDGACAHRLNLPVSYDDSGVLEDLSVSFEQCPNLQDYRIIGPDGWPGKVEEEAQAEKDLKSQTQVSFGLIHGVSSFY
jgi:hypothetical protein